MQSPFVLDYVVEGLADFAHRDLEHDSNLPRDAEPIVVSPERFWDYVFSMS